MNMIGFLCLPALAAIGLTGCGATKTNDTDGMWDSGGGNLVLPYPATTPEEQAEDLRIMRRNKVFGDLYQGPGKPWAQSNEP